MIETTRRGRVLVVDDDPLMRQIVMTALAKDNYELIEAGSGMEALERARADRPDLVLLDVMMPDMDGFEVCLRLRANPTTANVAVVLLTALGEIGDKVKGMQIGADDYVTKPFDPRELRSRVDAHLRRSTRDLGASPLTSLPGNPAIEQVMWSRLASREPVAVLYIDLTHFKAYNDEYGWLKGDELIKMLAKQIVDVDLALGDKDDFIGHIGGDDFVVISKPACAEALAQEVIARFDAAIPQFYDAEARARGYIETTDRQGNSLRAPLTSVAIAIVTNEQRDLEHPSQVALLAAEVKKFVKALPGSQYAFDRRRK